MCRVKRSSSFSMSQQQLLLSPTRRCYSELNSRSIYLTNRSCYYVKRSLYFVCRSIFIWSLRTSIWSVEASALYLISRNFYLASRSFYLVNRTGMDPRWGASPPLKIPEKDQKLFFSGRILRFLNFHPKMVWKSRQMGTLAQILRCKN